MSVETKFPLGFHEFFRYTVPGYIYLLVFFPPIFLTSSETVTIELLLSLNSFVSSALLLVAGPILGYLIFHIYYPIYRYFFYNYEETRPFQVIRNYASTKLNDEHLSETLVRALEDLAFYSESDPNLRPFDPDFKPLKDRMEFLFSSVHSLGATITAIWLGILSWAIWGLLDSTVSDYHITFNISWVNTFFTFAFFAVLWFATSIILLSSWSYRKNLAIMEEYLIVSTGKARIDKAIKAYAEEEAELPRQAWKGVRKVADRIILGLTVLSIGILIKIGFWNLLLPVLFAWIGVLIIVDATVQLYIILRQTKKAEK
ncbi:MAG: hypothetical protein NWE91_00290 [Candidatus Bathyarchaeota archaeon]|nr:hypothetical protein [Candidatus Bathyarchaeota archaeon]